MMTRLNLVLIQECNACAMSGVFTTMAKHLCLIDYIQFHIPLGNELGKMHLHMRSESEPNKLLFALFQEPIVREATILSDVQTSSKEPVKR
jgi:hypothetical protein